MSSRFQREDDIEEATEFRTTIRRFEVKNGLEINRTFGPGMSFNANILYALNRQDVGILSTRDNYWQVRSNLSKQF